jgi:hypothetical protein
VITTYDGDFEREAEPTDLPRPVTTRGRAHVLLSGTGIRSFEGP